MSQGEAQKKVRRGRGRRETYVGLGVDRTETWTELLQASRFLCIWGGAFLAGESHPLFSRFVSVFGVVV